jgi:hypothetical protein
MNFDDIPEIHFRGGYFICLAIMMLVVMFQLWVFHRLGWLRSVTRAMSQLMRGKTPKPTEPAAPLVHDADYTTARRSLPPREGWPIS